VQNASATETVHAILALTDYTLSLNFGRSPTQGQFVITGAQAGGPLERRIGFCVQIRKKCGQFGSDLLFLRHPSGELVTHENQSFFGLTEAQERMARPLFKSLPENEDYTLGYVCCNKIEKFGFIVADTD
jgi:hypothetical protein